MKEGVIIRRDWIKFSIFILLCVLNTSYAQKSVKKPPPLKYQMLFFRNDGRVWIVIPPKTTLVEIYPSFGRRHGWVKAYNRHGDVLALDRKFHGDVQLSTSVIKPSLKRGLLVVHRHNGVSIGIYTPENASFIEILNARNGFDGVVNVRDKKKRIIARQTGLDIKIINYR